MSLLGLSLRDMYPDLTNKWYQVVPVDLTHDGVFRLSTVASNEYYLGSCIVIIQDGTVTTDYTIPSGCVDPKSSCLMWFTDIGDITAEFLENPVSSYEFGQPVSIEDDLKGQDIALLFQYICGCKFPFLLFYFSICSTASAQKGSVLGLSTQISSWV